MMSRKRIFDILFIICIVGLVIQQCSLNQISGGTGAETGNAKIAGTIVDTSGTPVANVLVQLYPAEFNPVTDTSPQFPFADTTNTSGEYCFNVSDAGNYTILATKAITAENIIIGEISVDHNDVGVATDTLKKTGSIRINFTTEINLPNGFFYFRGTPINVFINDNDLAAGYVQIDSVPEGSFSTVYFLSVNHDYAAKLSDKITVTSEHTTIIDMCLCSMNAKGFDSSPLAATSTEYYSLGGSKVQLNAWLGQNVAFLTKSKNLDPCIMRRFVTVLDSAYQFNRNISGQTPPINKHFQGRLSIAESPSAEGIFIGAVGGTGIEMGSDQFLRSYNSVAEHNSFPQELFFVLAYNFNLYMNKLTYSSNVKYCSVVLKGFSVFMRFVTMDGLGIEAAPLMNLSINQFHAKIMGLMDLYLADSSLNFSNTLAIDTVTFSDLKAEHFFASVLMKLEGLFGDAFVMNIWKEVEKRPVAVSTQMAVDNLILASSAAAHVNLVPLFLAWKYPVSDSAKTEASKLYP